MKKRFRVRGIKALNPYRDLAHCEVDGDFDDVSLSGIIPRRENYASE